MILMSSGNIKVFDWGVSGRSFINMTKRSSPRNNAWGIPEVTGFAG